MGHKCIFPHKKIGGNHTAGQSFPLCIPKVWWFILWFFSSFLRDRLFVQCHTKWIVGRFVLVFFGGLTHIANDVLYLPYRRYCLLSHAQSLASSSNSLPSDDSSRQQLAMTAQLIKFIPSFQHTYHSTMTSISTLRGGEGGDSGDEWEDEDVFF